MPFAFRRTALDIAQFAPRMRAPMLTNYFNGFSSAALVVVPATWNARIPLSCGRARDLVELLVS